MLSRTLRSLAHKTTLSNCIRSASDIILEDLDPVQKALLDEECILVDRDDNPLGKASKKECHLIDPRTGKSPLHRAFSLFIFNTEDELLMTQRSSEKITFPGLWTNTCCSHPLFVDAELEGKHGLGAKIAASRKVFQELGIRKEHCPVDRMKYLTRIEYFAESGGPWAENEMDYILFLRQKRGHDLAIEPNRNEVQNHAFVKRNELGDFLADVRGQTTPWFQLLADNILPTWWANLDNLEKFEEHSNIHRY